MGREETNNLRQIWKAGSKKGMILFRNNVGVAVFPNGSVVKYGLCNGSSDLIGVEPVRITKDMVGQTIGQMVCIEVKTDDGTLSKDQVRFLAIMREAGAKVFVATKPEDLEA